MEYQTDKNYKPMKLNLAVKLAPLIFLAGAVTISTLLGALEGSVEGWNAKSMKKQARLTKKFEQKYQEAINNKYQINNINLRDYLNKNYNEGQTR